MILVPLLSLSGKRPAKLGIHGGELAPCPNSPNCVSSDASKPLHRVEPLSLKQSPEEAWSTVRAAVESIPRVSIITDTGDYLHAECSSALMGFVDDLELHLRGERGEIAVRSASRLGYGDLGVNRRRVEALRQDLQRQGVVR